MARSPMAKILTGLALLSTLALAGCGGSPKLMRASLSDRECLARAMYFESNRSSEDGMLAVGTVVMNRLNSGRYPNSICGVVGQRNQFAPGVLSRKMERGSGLAFRMADVVLSGKRHASVRKAMHFHTAGMLFPYRNMHYLIVAGGNAFYEKRRPTSLQALRENDATRVIAMGGRPGGAPRTEPEARPVVVASLQPQDSVWREPVAPRPRPARPPVAVVERPPVVVVEETWSEPAPPPRRMAAARPERPAGPPMALAPTSIEELIVRSGGREPEFQTGSGLY